jgi:hypothetical protein
MLTGDPVHFRQAAVSENVDILRNIIEVVPENWTGC